MSKKYTPETQVRFQESPAPIAVSLLAQALYNIVDSIYISSSL